MGAKPQKEYGQAMNRLQTILQNIDESQVPIDELADQVVEASELLRKCKKILTDTEVKVQTVLDDLKQEFESDDEAEDDDDDTEGATTV